MSGGTYRSADGTGYTPDNLGAAGKHYARTVPPCHPLPQNLPDPSVVFEALLKRDKFVPHPSGISSLLFSFATIIIHTVFQTRRTDPCVNEASSYLDLSPLYGASTPLRDAADPAQAIIRTSRTSCGAGASASCGPTPSRRPHCSSCRPPSSRC